MGQTAGHVDLMASWPARGRRSLNSISIPFPHPPYLPKKLSDLPHFDIITTHINHQDGRFRAAVDAGEHDHDAGI